MQWTCLLVDTDLQILLGSVRQDLSLRTTVGWKPTESTVEAVCGAFLWFGASLYSCFLGLLGDRENRVLEWIEGREVDSSCLFQAWAFSTFDLHLGKLDVLREGCSLLFLVAVATATPACPAQRFAIWKKPYQKPLRFSDSTQDHYMLNGSEWWFRKVLKLFSTRNVSGFVFLFQVGETRQLFFSTWCSAAKVRENHSEITTAHKVKIPTPGKHV